MINRLHWQKQKSTPINSHATYGNLAHVACAEQRRIAERTLLGRDEPMTQIDDPNWLA